MFSQIVRDRDNIEQDFNIKDTMHRQTIASMLSKMDRKTLDDAEQQLERVRNAYMRKRSFKWVVFIVFIFLGIIISYGVPALIHKLSSARYNRLKLEKLMEECLGEANITDAITDEVLIVAYDYNS